MTRSVTFAVLLAAVAAALPEEERIRARVEKIRKGDTDAWRRIPWASSLAGAAATAKEEARPMFVFSHEGNIDTGRC
jgi:hypothetical protein